LQKKRPGREATELTELRDHVRLIRIPQVGCQPSATIYDSPACACQGSAEPGEPAEHFGRQSDFFVEDATQVLAGNSGTAGEFVNGDDSAPLVHEGRQSRKIDGKPAIRAYVKPPQQRALQAIDALVVASRFCDVRFQ